MNKSSKYRPLMDEVLKGIVSGGMGVTGVYQWMLESLDEAEAVENKLTADNAALVEENQALRNELEALRDEVPPAENGKNRYGLDTSYFRNLFNRELNRSLRDFRPDELARVLARASRTADENVMLEKEFIDINKIKADAILGIKQNAPMTNNGFDGFYSYSDIVKYANKLEQDNAHN